MRRALAALLLAGVVLGAAGTARAHPLRFGALTVEEEPGGAAVARLRFSGTERRPDGADIVVPPSCVDRAPPTAVPIRYGVERERRLRCPPGALAAGPVGVRGIGEGALGGRAQVMLRLGLADGRHVEQVLDATRPVWRPAAAAAASRDEPSTSAVVWRYATLGVRHILLGFDHLLFLAVLLLAVRGRRPLFVAITSFTVGHSVTLALAALDVVRVPVAAVEAAIALSIAVVSADVVRRRRAVTADDTPWRAGRGRSAALVPAAFGLVHGLGFAAALRELGLPPGGLLPALVSFNLGVEAGQLLFVLAAVGLIALSRRLPLPDRPASRAAPVLAAYAAGAIAAWLCITRIAG